MSEDAKSKASRDEIVPRARGLRIGYLLASLVGLGASIELILLHIKAHTKPMERSFCSVHSKVDCLSVAEFFARCEGEEWLIVAYLSGASTDSPSCPPFDCTGESWPGWARPLASSSSSTSIAPLMRSSDFRYCASLSSSSASIRLPLS